MPFTIQHFSLESHYHGGGRRRGVNQRIKALPPAPKMAPFSAASTLQAETTSTSLARDGRDLCLESGAASRRHAVAIHSARLARDAVTRDGITWLAGICQDPLLSGLINDALFPEKENKNTPRHFRKQRTSWGIFMEESATPSRC